MLYFFLYTNICWGCSEKVAWWLFSPQKSFLFFFPFWLKNIRTIWSIERASLKLFNGGVKEKYETILLTFDSAFINLSKQLSRLSLFTTLHFTVTFYCLISGEVFSMERISDYSLVCRTYRGDEENVCFWIILNLIEQRNWNIYSFILSLSKMPMVNFRKSYFKTNYR